MALNVCSQVNACVRRLAQPSGVRGLARACRCYYTTVRISVGMLPGDSDAHVRGFGCARETVCAAGRDEGARARETECACRGHRSRAAGAPREMWATPVACSTCDALGPRSTQGMCDHEGLTSLNGRGAVSVCTPVIR